MEVEQYIQEECSNLDWTILGCPSSYELFFSMLQGDKMMIPGGGKNAIPCVSPQDVGAIAAQEATSNEGWTQQCCICVFGSFQEMATRVSRSTHREVRVVESCHLDPTF